MKIGFKFAPAVDMKRSLKQIKQPRSIHMCAPDSDLPSKISIMVVNEKEKKTSGPRKRKRASKIGRQKAGKQVLFVIFLIRRFYTY